LKRGGGTEACGAEESRLLEVESFGHEIGSCKKGSHERPATNEGEKEKGLRNGTKRKEEKDGPGGAAFALTRKIIQVEKKGLAVGGDRGGRNSSVTK